MGQTQPRATFKPRPPPWEHRRFDLKAHREMIEEKYDNDTSAQTTDYEREIIEYMKTRAEEVGAALFPTALGHDASYAAIHDELRTPTSVRTIGSKAPIGPLMSPE